MKSILTENLDLIPLKASDAKDLFELHSDPEVMRYIKPPVTEMSEIQKTIMKFDSYTEVNEDMGMWVARLEETEEFVGWCILQHIEQNMDNPIEIGYRLHKKFWGKGYATEMAKVLVEYAEKKLKIKNLCGITHPENIASQKVLEKAGFSFKENRTYYDVECKFYTT